MNKNTLLLINALFFILSVILFAPYYEISDIIINLIIIYPLLNIVFILLNKDWKKISFLMVILNLSMFIYAVYGTFVGAITSTHFFSNFLQTILINACYSVFVFLNFKYSIEKITKPLRKNEENNFEMENNALKNISSGSGFYKIIVKINKIFVTLFLFVGLYLFLSLNQIPQNAGLLAMAPMMIYSGIFFLATLIFIVYYLFYFLQDIKNKTVNKIILVINKIINTATFIFLIYIFLFFLYVFLK